MVSAAEGQLFKSKMDPCGVCGKRMIANDAVLRSKYGNWDYDRCEKIERATTRLAALYVWSRCREIMKGMVDLTTKL